MQTDVLDNKAATAAIDKENMLQILEDSPESYEQAYAAALRSDTLPPALRGSVSHLAYVGLGGSAIAGDVVREWLFESDITIEVIRGENLPGSVKARTCVLIVSYSGQTAEALKALKEAIKRKSRVSCVASGGEMIEICRKMKIPHVQVGAGLQPREALPQLLSGSLATLQRWGICDHSYVRSELRTVTEQLIELRNTVRFTRSQAGNPAKQLAVQLHGKIPCVYSTQLLGAAGRRFKNQLNENAKVLAKFEVLPEMLHNEVESWRMLGEGSFADSISFVLLRGCETEYEKERFDQLTDLIRRAGGRAVHEISQKSESRLATILGTIYRCDYVSFYLAVLRGVDPTPVETIRTLKRAAHSSSVQV